MSRPEIKHFYKDVLNAVDYEYNSILKISQKAKTSWEATKNCLEVLEYINIIKKDDSENVKYKKRHLIDIEKLGALI